MKKLRIVLADDHVIVRQGLRALLEDEPDIEVVGEANHGREAIEVVREAMPDVVLVDVAMPDMDGISATRVIHQECPRTRVLFLSSSQDQTTLLGAVRAGATGFIHKSAPVESVAHSIRAAARGEVQFSPGDAMFLVRELQRPMQPEHLTGREMEVLEMICEGLANKEIAWKLRISEKTVKSHVSTILSKFGLESRTQLALHALRLGLVTPFPRSSATPEGGGRILPMDGPRRLNDAAVC
jgi:DNA-binding NarL/FixJ family response regulator